MIWLTDIYKEKTCVMTYDLGELNFHLDVNENFKIDTNLVQVSKKVYTIRVI